MPTPLLRLILPCLLLFAAWPTARAGLPELVRSAKTAVVAVGVYNELDNPRFSFRGTGFVIGDGLTLATNAHVLPDDVAALQHLALQIGGNREPGQAHAQPTRPLKLLQVDRIHDLAVLQIGGAPLPTLTLAAAGAAREGQSVAFIGFPIGGLLGFAPVTHHGIISSITPIALPPSGASHLDAAAVSRLRQGPFDIYQLDATAYPGNSGGPLLDADTGQVLGLVNMVLLKNTHESALSAPSGISYAIPVRWLHELLERR